MKTRILLVDDDRFLLDQVRRLLTQSDFEVATAASASEAFDRLAEEPPDLAVLDLGLPDMDGVSLCRRMREKHRFPILMLTARSDAMDKVVGLEVGADDYLTKPFEPAELVARVRALLRRSREYGVGSQEAMRQVGDLALDPGIRDARVDGRAVGLTKKEFALLEHLAANSGRVVTREALFERTWDDDIAFASNSLDVHVYRLRKKIEPDPENPRYLHTHKGVGFRLEDEGSS